jgi:RNA polymerase sigma-70 factor (ECF subfamily)
MAEAAEGKSERAFEELAAPQRRAIKLHCYRMLGSLHEAEDLTQETYLRAWRGFASFDGRAFPAWLHRIATNACLNALETKERRARLLPDELGPASNTVPPGEPSMDLPWLEPFPDAALEGFAHEASSPEARYSAREAVQLAFVAGLQALPPRQRAALLLCDVLGWTAAEAATLLGGSTASINSALQRARDTLGKRYPSGRPSEAPATDAAQAQLLGRYVRAFEGHDMDGLVALLKQDATAVMPPWREWYAGRAAIGAFFAAVWKLCGGVRMVPTAANGQPAFAVYRASGEAWAAHSIQLLALEGPAIARLSVFVDAKFFDAFGLPRTLPNTTG